MSGPATVAIANDAAMYPLYLPRSRGETIVAMMTMVSVIIMPIPTPCSTRVAMS